MTAARSHAFTLMTRSYLRHELGVLIKCRGAFTGASIGSHGLTACPAEDFRIVQTVPAVALPVMDLQIVLMRASLHDPLLAMIKQMLELSLSGL
jgi:hypothetical protein